jgi:hypothetical protein
MEIERLRKDAELNLCKDCYQKYLALIEPTIERWLFKPLDDWRTVESYVTRMVMIHKGVFKSDAIYISLSEDAEEKCGDKVDVKAFRKIKKWRFKEKIKYLHEHGILQDSSYGFLYKMSNIRNRIHDWLMEFSEQDLALFRWAKTITLQIHDASTIKLPTEISANMKSNAEKTAEWLLKETDSRHRNVSSETSSQKGQ